MTTNLVQYGTFDVETAAEELAQSEASGGNDFMKLAEGDNIVRFLPPKPGDRTPFKVIYEHFVKMPGGDSLRFACPRSMCKPAQPCPICIRADKLKATGVQSDFTAAKELFPKRRVYANVIDRANPDAGPKVLVFGKMIHDALLKLRQNPDWGGDFTHPETGFDVRITRTGSGLETEYDVTPRRPSSLGNMEWLDQQRNLAQYAQVLTPEEMRTKVREAGGGQPAKVVKTVNPVVDATAPAKARTVVDDLGGGVDDDIPF